MIDSTNNYLWIQSIANHDIYGNLEFKIPQNKVDNYPIGDLKNLNVSFVSPEEFLMVDDQRIPLFIETSYGMTPDIEIVKFVANPKFRFAVIKSSFLSGHLFGLTIKEYNVSEMAPVIDLIKFS